MVPRVLEPNAGGVDIGAEQIYAAVSPDRTEESVRCFGTFTEDLYALAAWLRQHGVTSVAMEATGVFWVALFRVLESCNINVCLVNAQHAKNVPGRKSDVQDCQWLQYLHSVGLLRSSFLPPAEIEPLRALLRHRATVVEDGARYIQLMQKSLTQMNVQVHHVLTDISGVSGLAIIDAILKGEKDPKVLVALRERGVKASEETMMKAMIGDYRDEHLFTLGQARAAYAFCRQQMRECDGKIEELLADLETVVDPQDTPPPPPTKAGKKTRKGEIALPQTDLRTELYRVFGTDVTQVPSLGVSNTCALLAELGPDLQPRFGSSARFCSWMALCPNPQVSGGRVIRKGTRPVKQRCATIFRVAAQTLARSRSWLGECYRRFRMELGPQGAVTAMAHKLARIFYHLVTTRTEYDESVFKAEEELREKKRLTRLKRDAARLGFTLVAQTVE